MELVTPILLAVWNAVRQRGTTHHRHLMIRGHAQYLCGADARAGVFRKNADGDGADGGAERRGIPVVGTFEPACPLALLRLNARATRTRAFLARSVWDQPALPTGSDRGNHLARHPHDLGHLGR